LFNRLTLSSNLLPCLEIVGWYW